MITGVAQTSSTDPALVDAVRATSSSWGLQGFVFALFFIFGGITSLNDVIIPKLKGLFTLSYSQAMLVQSAFFAAYFIVSLPASLLVRRVGYLRGAAAGLLIMMAGCLLFVPASASAEFSYFLSALFVLAAGVTLVQVVANPLISALGPALTAHSRLAFAQAFNSLGTTIFPYVGAVLILGSLAHVDAKALTGAALLTFRKAESEVIVRAYIGLAVALAVVAAAVWSQRNRLPPSRARVRNPLLTFAVLKRPRLAFGALSIFLYVGAEVAIGSLIVNYLMQSDVLGLSQAEAGKHVPLYWGGAMIGRFVGAYVLRIASPGKVLAGACAAAMALLLLSGQTHGALCGYAILAIGLLNSIMFPTIFALACDGLGEQAADGSGVICMAIVGGAIVPPLTGHVADVANLRTALIIPGICYAVILAFGLATGQPRARPRPVAA